MGLTDGGHFDSFCFLQIHMRVFVCFIRKSIVAALQIRNTLVLFTISLDSKILYLPLWHHMSISKWRASQIPGMVFVFARGQHVTLSHLACKLPLGCHLSCAEDSCHPSAIQGCGTGVPSVSSCLLPLLQWQMLGWGAHGEPRICYYQFGSDSDPSPSSEDEGVGDVCLWGKSTITRPLPPDS